MTKSAKPVSLLPLFVALLLLTGCGGGEASAPAAADAPPDTTIPTLYWLDVWENSVYRATGPNFADQERLVHPTDMAPDGIAVDVAGRKLYWTNMGDILGFGGGTLQRSDLDGTGVERIIEPGVTHTPKQMQLDLVHGHVYWCDRQRGQVWRAGLDGSNPEAIVSEQGLQQLVGIALDIPAGKIYFSDRGLRTISRTGMSMPAGQTSANRTDIEELLAFPEGAMPTDIDIDLEHAHLYWTDRALGTVQRAGLDVPAGQTAAGRGDVEKLVTGASEPIGISLDVPNGKMYYGQAGDPLTGTPGTITEATLEGTQQREVGRASLVTGVALVHVPAS